MSNQVASFRALRTAPSVLSFWAMTSCQTQIPWENETTLSVDAYSGDDSQPGTLAAPIRTLNYAITRGGETTPIAIAAHQGEEVIVDRFWIGNSTHVRLSGFPLIGQ